MALYYEGVQFTTIGAIGPALHNGIQPEITSHRYTPGLEYTLPEVRMHYLLPDEDKEE